MCSLSHTLALWHWFSLLRELLISNSVTKTENVVQGQAYAIWYRLLCGEWQRWLQKYFRNNILLFPTFWDFFLSNPCKKYYFWCWKWRNHCDFSDMITALLQPQCQLGSPWHSCLVVIKKPHFSHLPVLFTSSSILETLGSFLVLSQLMLFGKQINHAPVWKQGRMMLIMCFFVTVTWIQTPSVVCLKN